MYSHGYLMFPDYVAFALLVLNLAFIATLIVQGLSSVVKMQSGWWSYEEIGTLHS